MFLPETVLPDSTTKSSFVLLGWFSFLFRWSFLDSKKVPLVLYLFRMTLAVDNLILSLSAVSIKDLFSSITSRTRRCLVFVRESGTSRLILSYFRELSSELFCISSILLYAIILRVPISMTHNYSWPERQSKWFRDSPGTNPSIFESLSFLTSVLYTSHLFIRMGFPIFEIETVEFNSLEEPSIEKWNNKLLPLKKSKHQTLFK